MPMQRRTLLLSIIALSILFSCLYFLLQNINTLSPLGRIKNAQEVAKLTGEYAFRSEIDQITNLSPNTSNYGKQSRHDTFVVEGAVNESQQTSNLTISNTQGVLMEVKRERGVTYMRQAGGAWQQSTSSGSASQLNSLSFLAGVSNATRDMSDTQRYAFDFDGAKFSDHFARLLSADEAHGIAHNQEWTDIANSAQYRLAHGNGKIAIDSDGLPQSIEMQITMPGDKKQGSSNTRIATTFFNYARTGLALQKLAHNPFYMFGNLVGSDVSTVRSLLLGCIAVLLLIVSVSVLFAMRRKLYVPMAILVIGIMLFQPFSNIPRTLAASQTPPVVPDTPSSPTTPPEPEFNPLVAPFNQGAAIALPAAGTSTASGMVVGTSATQRLARNASTTNSNAVDTDKDGLSDNEETLLGTDSTNADTDSDGLSDSQEISIGTNPLLADVDGDGLNDNAELQVGTDHTLADSDYDGLADFAEVTTFTQYAGSNNKFYSNPLDPDTNGDGINDGQECFVKQYSPSAPCSDSDGNGVPDFLSFDNDGDKVSDTIDISPDMLSTVTYTKDNPFNFKITNTTTSTVPLDVNIQIRPNNDNLLYANDAVYDWPSGDTQGQVQRGKDSTYATSSLFTATDTKSTNGDVKTTALLEVRVPLNYGPFGIESYGNLPIAPCELTYPPTCPTQTNYPDWLDKTKLDSYGISVAWSKDDKGNILNGDNRLAAEVTLGVPLLADYDKSGTITSYSATLQYQTSQIIWSTNHSVRLQWIITSIQDACPSDKPDCAVSERIETNAPLQVYYGNWKLIGISAIENKGVKTALIYEDSTQSVITNPIKRRLNIAKIKALLSTGFLKHPFYSIDGSDVNKSISLLFDNTKNATAQTGNNFDPLATKVATFNYPDDGGLQDLFTNRLPTILNNTLCKANGASDNCANQQTLRTSCETLTSVACRPAALVLTEKTTRTTSLNQFNPDSNNIDFANVETSVLRTMQGQIYKVVSGRWEVANDNDIQTEVNFALQAKTNEATPANLSDNDWNNWRFGMISSIILDFQHTESKGYLLKTTPLLTYGITPASFNTTATDSWGYYIKDTYTYFSSILDDTSELSPEKKDTSLHQKFKDSVNDFFNQDPNSVPLGKKPNYLKVLNVTKGIAKELAKLDKNYQQNPKMDGTLKSAATASRFIGIGLVMLADSGFFKTDTQKLAVTITGQTLQLFKPINDVVHISIELYEAYKATQVAKILPVVEAVFEMEGTLFYLQAFAEEFFKIAGSIVSRMIPFYDTYKLMATMGWTKAIEVGESLVKAVTIDINNISGAITKFSTLVSESTIVKNIGKVISDIKVMAAGKEFGRLASKAGTILVVVMIAMVWVLGIMQAVKAEYGYQKANIIGNMIGQTATMIILVAMASTGVGALIAAIVAVLDIISMIACRYLSDKQIRSTAGQWLCGGISGIAAKFLSPYAASIVVDPNDPFSRYQNITGGGGLSRNIDGFSTGNSYRNTLAVTDYIQKMPFPAQWQSVFFAWQWKNLDERETSFVYGLDPYQIDLSSSAVRGAQVGEWQTNDSGNSDYYSDGDKSYKWKKTFNVEYITPLTTSGINVQMSDLWLSEAFKVPQQTCISIPNPLIFWPLIPICWIETLDGNPKYTNINETDKTIFDVFPATIDEFVSLRQKNNGYTFAWTDDNVQPAFPVFVDADNDGVPNSTELISNSFDNDWDSDNDGISDYSEINVTYSKPNVVDSDNDGLNDSQEILYGTNQLMPDTDGDGLLDGEEVVRVDANGNVAGGWQVTYAIVDGLPQTTWTGSDPTTADGDDDSITDLREKVLGWSPYAKNSAELIGLAGDVREALIPVVQSTFEPINPTSFSNTGYSGSMISCADVASCPAVTSSGVRLPNTTALQFDGNDKLDAGSGPQATFDSQFTLSLWIKPTYQSAPHTIFVQPGHIGVFRTVQGNVEIKLSTNAQSGATSGVDWTYQQTTNAVLPVNTWTNLVVTYANNTVIVYVNGSESSRFFTSGTLFDKSTVNNNLNIGGSYINSGTTRYTGILGLLDDMSIYRIALSAKEVALLAQDKLENANNDLIVRPGDRIYSNITTSNKLLGRSMQGYTTVTAQSTKNDYQASQMTALGLPANTSAAIENIIEVPGALNPVTATNSYVNSCVFPRTELCVKFDETNTTFPLKFSDVSPNQSVLTCSNTAACPSYVTSNWKFTSNTDMATSASVGNAISSRDFTVSLWVKPEDQSVTNRTIVMSKNSNAVLKLALANEYPQFTIGSTTLAATTRLVIGQWQHLVFRLMLGKRQIFVDGVNVASDTTAISYPSSAFGELRIGKDATTNSLMGSLRDIQINSLALSDNDIATLAKTCEDPRLIACMPFNASTTAAQSIDYSRYGIDQGVALNCSGCTTSNNSEINFASSTMASLPNGYASLINDHDFSIMLKIKLASVAGTQTIMQSSVITTTGNQLQIQVINGRPTVVRKNVVAGVTTSSDSASIDNLTLSANTWYVLTAKQGGGRLSMTAYSANGSTLQSTSKEIAATALTQAQEPLTLGTTGLSVDLLRMYRTGLTSANMAALANYALFGNLSINLNQAPQSDSMPITVEARNKIIVPDANFERIRGNCDESSAVLCVPFDRDMNTAYPDPMANATATQSSTAIGWPAQYAMDKNFGTMNHTNADANAWLHFDLGQVRDIATVTIYDRADCCQTRSDSAKVFVSTEPMGGRTPSGLIAQGGASAWKNMKCDNQNQTQVCASKNVFDVTFAKGTRGRYVYITVANNPLHFREVVVNSNSDIQSCNRTNTCPTFNAGGNEFVSANKQSITLSTNLAQSTFNGTKNYTVMSWVKLKDPMAKNVFIGDNSGIADGPLNTDSNFRIEGGILRVGPTTCTDCTYYYDGVGTTTAPGSDRPLSANTWYHVALVRSGTTQIIYLNGVRYMSKAAAYTFNNVRQMEIGGASGQLNGSLRDFQIHGTAIDVSKIKLSASSPAYELRMPFDEPALSTAFSDVLTTGLQLECVATCPLSGVPGRDNRAVRFSGNQPLRLGNSANAFASYLKVVDPNSQLPQKSFNLSMWVKPTKYGVWLLGNDTINQMMRLGIDANGFVSYEHAYACYNAFCWPKTPLRSATKLPLNTWSHIHVTQYPESGGYCGMNYSTAAIAINGIYSNSGLTIPVRMCSMTYADTNMPVTASGIGGTIINSAGQTSPQLTNLNNYSSTTPKPPATVTDQTKQGWTFVPETNQGITFGDMGRLTNSNAATIAFWVKPLGLTGDERLLQREGQYYFRLVNNRLYFAFYAQYGGWTDYDTTFTLTTNAWQHVALTYEGPSGNCNNTCNSLVIRAGTQSKIFQLQGAILSYPGYETTPLTTGYTVANKGLEHNFSIANIFVTPRKLSDSELTALQSETFTTDNLRKYGNVDPANSTLNIGETFVGDIDEFRISPIGNSLDYQTQVKQAPNWNLSFEDTLSSSQTKVTNGLTVTTPINSVVLPDDVPGRAGIGRFNYAANCTNPDILGANCPVADTLGMEGMASTFNGQDTLLQVNNATTIINDIKNGGTVRLMIHPDKTVGNQTVLYYGNSAGTIAPLRVRLVADKVEIRAGTKVFTSTTSLPIAWNQIAFRFGSNGFRYYQNGTLDTGASATTDSAVTLTSDASYKLRIGGVGKIAGVFTEMYDGSIDEISLTPSESEDAKIYRIARSQFSHALTKSKVAELTIDADAPVITITNPQYTSRIPIQFSIKTSDPTSSVQRVTTAITSTLSATGSVIAPTTTEIPSAACTDTVGGTNYCPTFQVNQTATVPVEGKYGIVVTAADAVNNTSTQKSLIYVDTTAPTVSLIRNSGTYTTSRALDQNSHHLLLRFTVSDPCIGYTSCSVAGSGVASVSINLKESGGRTINLLPIPTTRSNGAWVADVSLPFGDPSGFYQVNAITTDNVGNSKEVVVAGANSPIEVDNTPPQDVIASPSPYDANTYFIGNQAITGRVSDYVDGRAAIRQGMRVRLDFEAPDGASVFDNRGDSRYNTSCTICPTVALDTTDASKRIARFNIEGINQSLTIANAATVLTGTFGIALMVKITNAGTILSTGIASNPRLRIKAEKVGTTFKVTAQRGTKALSTPATIPANVWHHLIYSEYGTTMSLQYGTQLKTMPEALTVSTTGTTTPLLNDIIIGAVQSNATTAAKEDYFSGYLDDIVVSRFALTNIDLLGTSISKGSGVQAAIGHQVRLNVMDDGYTGSDQLASLAGYYLPINQSTYPVLDSITGVKSASCLTSGIFLGTCPQLIDGFSSNAITFNKATDGIQTGYSLQSSGVVSHSLALRFKINPNATSGLLASLQAPTTVASLAMQVLYQKDIQAITVRMNNSSAILLATSESIVPIDDNNWHTLIITSRGTNSTTKQIDIYLDGKRLMGKSITGNWVNAPLGLGAMAVAPYTGTSTTTTAATNTIVDDVAVFNTALSPADMRNYSYGYSTVYHETFDNPSLTPNSTIVENSPFNQSSNVLSSDTTLTSVVGNVGSGALRFDGNDEIVHRDTNAITFADANSPWSIATWITPAQTQSATIASGNANGFIYQLTLDSGRPKFSNGTMTITAPSAVSTTSASLVVVSNDGVTTRMYINGSMVASATTSGTTVPVATNAQVQFTSFKMCLSCSPTSSNAAYDNNMATSWAAQLSMNNTNLEATADNVNTIDRITIYNTNTTYPLRNFYVFVYDATLTDDSINSLKANAKWFYYNPGSVTDHIIIPVPYGIKAKKVRIVKLGNGESLALNEVKVLQLPQIRVGTGFVGVIDDLRIYRRALTTVDIARLQAMAWRPSTLTTRDDGYTWQQPAFTDIEANTSIQSMTIDVNGNSRRSSGERSLWNGMIDTKAPAINVSGSSTNYVATINDRNLIPTQINTPCGSKLQLSNQPANSLWFLTRMSFLDGTVSPITGVNASCTLSTSPELIQTNSQNISSTTSLVFGKDVAYVGINNTIRMVSAQSQTTMLGDSTPVNGTVILVNTNRTKTRLYTISRIVSGTSTQTILSLFDIATNGKKPALLSSLPIELAPNATVTQMGIANNGSQDTFVVLVDSQTPATIMSVNVANASQPTRTADTTALFDNTYNLAIQDDIVVLAHGVDGVSINRIDNVGSLDSIARYQTQAYVNNLFFSGKNLLLVDDEEPIDSVTPIQSTNTLRVIPLIDTIVSGSANINSTLIEASNYTHLTRQAPFGSDDFASYRIQDVAAYIDNSVLILSGNPELPSDQRISMVRIADNSVKLLSDTRLSTPNLTKIATNNQFVITLGNNNTSLVGMQISDARLDTSACDIVNNCTTIPSSYTATLALGQTPPAQASVRILNQVRTYTVANPTIYVSAEAPAGVRNISLTANGASIGTPWVAGSVNPLAMETAFPLVLGTGVYTIVVSMTDTNSVVTTSSMNVIINTNTPTVTFTTQTFGLNQIVNGNLIINATITDGLTVGENLYRIQVIDNSTNTVIPYTIKPRQGTSIPVSILYRSNGGNTTSIPLTLIVTDGAGRTTSTTATITFDSTPPIVTNPIITAKLNGATTYTTLQNGQLVTPTTDIATDLHVEWSAISDQSSISRNQIEYLVKTNNGSTAAIVATTVPANTSTIAAGRLPVIGTGLPLTEASRMDLVLHLTDGVQNDTYQPLSSVYIDKDTTPDYTLMDDSPIYRGFLNTRCTILDSDTRATANGNQQFAVTWDSQAVRFNWQGADWNYNGNLFIYLDSIANAGTTTAYRPPSYTKTITDSLASGASFITLPINTAARTSTTNGLTYPSHALGSDYVIHVQSRTSINLMRWDSTAGAWVNQDVIPDYRYAVDADVKQTDIRLLFSQIGYTATNPLGMVAFATDATVFAPWATFPPANPVRNSQSDSQIAMTPLTSGYGWATLGSTQCPKINQTAPVSSQITAAITSAPMGVYKSTVADIYPNTEPDSIKQAIAESTALCGVLTSNPWCVAASNFLNNANNSAAMIRTLATQLTLSNAPVAGHGQNVTYTFTIKNPTTRATRPLYALVETYGDVWLTDGNTAAATPTPIVTIVAGGIYSYHSIANSGLRDYQVIKINAIPANTTQQIVLNGLIDRDKANTSTADRLRSQGIAKITVRISDTATPNATTITGIDTNRIVETINAAQRIDTAAPSQIVADNQQSIKRGNTSLTGNVTDASAVTAVTMEYTTSSNSSAQTINCGAAIGSRWQCPITIPTNISSITYRLRASDTYNQQSDWSAWYTAGIDQTAPTFNFNTITTNLLASAYVGGSNITVSGIVNDNNNQADISLCDSQNDACEFATISNPTTISTTYTTTAAPNSAIAVSACSETEFADYSRFGLTPTGVSASARVQSLTVTVKATSAASQNITLWLQSPSGTRIPLLTSSRTSTTTDLNAQFTDSATSATTNLGNAASDTAVPVRADGMLATVSGEPVNGLWQLWACDNGGSSASTLTQWWLTITSATTPTSNNAPWSYALKNTANQDGVMRNLVVWAVDKAKNTSAPREFTLNVDTVAPQLTIAQVNSTVLASSQTTMLQGSISDGGNIAPATVPNALIAVVYSQSRVVRTDAIIITALPQTQEVQRLNYLTNRAFAAYSWQYQFNSTNLSAGDYTVQLTAQDGAGNRRISNSYVITVPQTTQPALSNVAQVATNSNDSATFKYQVDTGKGETTINTTVQLEKSAAPEAETISDSSTIAWFTPNTQQYIPASVQGVFLKQLGMNEASAVALDNTGTMTTWAWGSAYRSDYTFGILQPLKNVRQFAIGADPANPHLLVLSNTGIITDFTSSAATTIVSPTQAVSIAAGKSHYLAVLKSGKLTAWGSNTNGESTIPVAAQMGVSQIGAGDNFSVALTNNGRVIAWGNNDYGQTTVPISATNQIAQIAVGDQHVLALRQDGQVISWGRNNLNQTQLPSYCLNTDSPCTQFYKFDDVVAITAYRSNSVAISYSGAIYMWGQRTLNGKVCCYGANLIAGGFNGGTTTYYSPVITNHMSSTQVNSTIIQASDSPIPQTVTFTNLIPYRRYRYTMTVTNSAGSNTYTGTFDTTQSYNQLFVPLLSNASPLPNNQPLSSTTVVGK